MKKILFIALLVLSMAASASAMQSINENDLAAITGQAGVSISLDLTVDLTVGTAAWGDSDGIAVAGPSAGWVGISGLTLTGIQMRARNDWSNNLGVGIAGLKFITIDVGTGAGAYNAVTNPYGIADANYGGKTFVRIGIPTLELKTNALTTKVFLSPGTATTPNTAANAIQYLGDVYVGAINAYIGIPNDLAPTVGGYIDISAGIGPRGATGSQSGVGITVSGLKIDSIQLATLSWGDPDGQKDISAVPGYVGLSNLTLGEILVDAGLAINIGTINAGETNAANLYTAKGFGAKTFVNLAFVGLTKVQVVGAITADVVLDNVNTLDSGSGQTLGSIYVNGISANVRPGGYINIFAH